MQARYRLAPLLVLMLGLAQAADRHVPTIDELLQLKSLSGGTQISPDGRYVAYAISQADFKQDAFVTSIWLADTRDGTSRQLTQGTKSAHGPQWSPDGRYLAFLSNRAEDKEQLFAIRPDGGEAVQLSKSETSLRAFAWSPDGKAIAYTANEAPSQASKDRKAHFADYEVVRKETQPAQLWTLETAEALNAPQAGKQRTHNPRLSIEGFSWSPDGRQIAFSGAASPEPRHLATSDIYRLVLADNSVEPVVRQPGPDQNPQWSPDGQQIVFVSAMGQTDFFALNLRLAVVPAEGGMAPRSISNAFDENPSLIAWKADGVYFNALQRTASHLFRADPANGRIARVTAPDSLMASSFSLTPDGKRIAFAAPSPTSLSEVFVSDAASFAPKAVTQLTEQTRDFLMASRELVRWKSQDGTEIEGVLIKPADFDAGKKYPLLTIIHGGPTGIDRPTLLDTRYYPADLFAARGALLLKVNYRGSAGYGEKFRRLNERNLGVGDAWDVVSGVDHLVAQGLVDKHRVASMGWSQGGFISAFLGTATQRFVAVSMGAGISDWATYYYNTDIPQFTRNYLGATPVQDPAVYARTSPFGYMKQARTPTLIQHGELDKRVPIANAYQLRQALEDQDVPVEMIVYKGFGHGITKPKSARAQMQHNLDWFAHWIFKDPLPDFAAPSVPKAKKD
ncbi:S9 family peptidase [Pelomonas sp. SE-A7]|uniref:S9 family peptidase n=1 Tax=Pelomonas sp. SE-A7 TaxID=3054953 RepID=UPI00259CEBA9|nr:S9 family peptidase [Pelomonas sp. SE-A7]MDM4767266.1 S9 family peptidase [Pelomonas sp. SE-A7]